MGATSVGDLVDVGRAAHFDSRVVADLRELSDAASIFRKRTNTGTGRGACDLRCTGRSTGLFLDLDFRTQHPQPVIGGGGSLDPRMWTAFLIQLAGLFVFRIYGVLVPVSIWKW